MATHALLDWCKANAGALPVSLAAGAAEDRTGITLRLVAASEATSLSDLAVRPHRLCLTYRISVSDDEPAAAHAALIELMFAALATPVLTVTTPAGDVLSLPMALVSGQAAIARYGAFADPASLYLDVTIERARPGRTAGVVQEPPVLRTKRMN
ncbi:hypothetical protein OU426_01660 [Frigidibacter sp. RF13]|uniref:hypothetical protein n=1 Tax=Frigidibacter sp. RF13 TaxID=2997340 RepID=UPI00226D4AE3|nr:hypothetical protein [Frigidibacter sp. RF13]MCY1125547.1 hypothetical protein [Frigidibacter sp. RF13]